MIGKDGKEHSLTLSYKRSDDEEEEEIITAPAPHRNKETKGGAGLPPRRKGVEPRKNVLPPRRKLIRLKKTFFCRGGRRIS